jgi:hypothetical protein
MSAAHYRALAIVLVSIGGGTSCLPGLERPAPEGAARSLGGPTVTVRVVDVWTRGNDELVVKVRLTNRNTFPVLVHQPDEFIDWCGTGRCAAHVFMLTDTTGRRETYLGVTAEVRTGSTATISPGGSIDLIARSPEGVLSREYVSVQYRYGAAPMGWGSSRYPVDSFGRWIGTTNTAERALPRQLKVRR